MGGRPPQADPRVVAHEDLALPAKDDQLDAGMPGKHYAKGDSIHQLAVGRENVLRDLSRHGPTFPVRRDVNIGFTTHGCLPKVCSPSVGRPSGVEDQRSCDRCSPYARPITRSNRSDFYPDFVRKYAFRPLLEGNSRANDVPYS